MGKVAVVAGLLSLMLYVLGFQHASSSPHIINVSIYPEKVAPNDVMVITAHVSDSDGISSVVASIENMTVASLKLKQGNETDGIWEAEWLVSGVEFGKWYNMTITATDLLGNSNHTTILFHDDPTFAYMRHFVLPTPINNGTVFINTSKAIEEGKMRLDCGDIRISDTCNFDSATWNSEYDFKVDCSTGRMDIFFGKPVKEFCVFYGNKALTSVSNSSLPNATYYILRRRKAIYVKNPYGTPLVNYSINFTLNTSSLIATGDMRNDCKDVRFYYSNGTEINGDIANCNEEVSYVWVKIPYIKPNLSTTIYMYYGNPLVSIDRSFVLYDDFNGNSLDSNRWEVYKNKGYSINGGILTISDDGGYWDGGTIIYSKKNIQTPWVFEGKVDVGCLSNSFWAIFRLENRTGQGYAGLYDSECASNVRRIYSGNASGDSYVNAETISDSQPPYTFKLINNGTSVKYYRDGSFIREKTDYIPTTPMSVRLSIDSYYYTISANIYWVYVYPYNNGQPEPQTTVSDTEHGREQHGIYLSGLIINGGSNGLVIS